MYEVVGALATRTLRLLWLLEELGQDYRFDPAPPRSDRVRALDPVGKVPLLLTDGRTLSESVAIMTYLADRHGGCTFPAGTLDRAVQDGFTQFFVDAIEGPLWAASKHSFVLPEEKRVPAIKAVCRWEFAEAMETLGRRLGPGPYLMGEAFTVPDILFGHGARWAKAAKFPLPDGPVGAYLTRVGQRPALARALERGASAST